MVSAFCTSFLQNSHVQPGLRTTVLDVDAQSISYPPNQKFLREVPRDMCLPRTARTLVRAKNLQIQYLMVLILTLFHGSGP